MREDPESRTAKTNIDEQVEDVDPLVGCVLSGKYRILEKIGSGGMSIVYKAQDLLLDRTVAIKCLSGDVQEEGLSRFRREGIATGKLDSPHIVNVHELFIAPEQNPYLVMDYVQGEPLSNIIRLNGKLNVKRAVHIIIQAAQALEHAHSRGIVHRDIKPSNMIVTTVGGDHNFVKIVDFGIAKLQTPDEHGQQLTKAGDVFGSPIYMSPEQCSGLTVDSRSDIYSLGCVFYEMLVGEPPLLGANSLQTMRKHIDQIPLKPSELRTIKDLSPNIENVIMRCLQKEPANRYQNLRAFVNDLNKEDAPKLSPGFSLPGRAHPFWLPIAVGLGVCGFVILKYFYMAPSPDSTQTESNQLSQETEVVPEIQPDANFKKSEAKPEVKQGTKAEVKPGVKPVSKVETKSKAQEKPDVKLEAKAKPKTEATTKVTVELQPKPESKAQAKPESKAEAKPETKPHSKPDTKTEAKAKANTEQPKVASHKPQSSIAMATLPPPDKSSIQLSGSAQDQLLHAKLAAAAFDVDNQDYAGGLKKYRDLLPLAAKIYGSGSREYANIVEKTIGPADHVKDTRFADWATRTALNIHAKLDDPAGAARLYGWMGWLAHVGHHDDQSIKYFETSFKLGQQNPHTTMMYADVLKAMKRYPQAEHAYLQSLQECDAQNHHLGMTVLRKLENLYKEMNRPDKVQQGKQLKVQYKKRWGMDDR